MFMILNTGGRTDTVQYYTKWLLRRFEEGYALSRNPLFPNKVTRYELVPEKIDCIVFCSKNYAPILPHIKKIASHFNTYFHYTITAYEADIEPLVPSINKSINTLMQLSKIVGSEKIAWRYDPILITQKYTIERHLKTFGFMAEKLAPHIDRCIFSFVEIYKKLQFNMPELMPISTEDMNMIAEELGKIATSHNMTIQTCGTNIDFERFGILKSGCTTLDIIGRANGIVFNPRKHNGMRAGCHCIESRDIGAYDTCPNDCRYCYANSNIDKARENFRTHDPFSPLLLGTLNENDIVQQGNQKIYCVGA